MEESHKCFKYGPIAISQLSAMFAHSIADLNDLNDLND